MNIYLNNHYYDNICIMLTAFVRKILVLGTNQTKMVSGRLVSNHSNTGYPLIFIWCYHKLITAIILLRVSY